MKKLIPGWRNWLFPAMAMLVCALMLLSFALPWWIGDLGTGNSIRIYGWGLTHNLRTLAPYVSQDVTPLYQVLLAWVYIAADAALVVFSLRLKRIAGACLMGVVGLGYVAYALVAAFMVMAPRMRDFGIAMQGYSILPQLLMNISVTASLQAGYYLACVCGGWLICLALFRGFFIHDHMAASPNTNNERGN